MTGSWGRDNSEIKKIIRDEAKIAKLSGSRPVDYCQFKTENVIQWGTRIK